MSSQGRRMGCRGQTRVERHHYGSHRSGSGIGRTARRRFNGSRLIRGLFGGGSMSLVHGGDHQFIRSTRPILRGDAGECRGYSFFVVFLGDLPQHRRLISAHEGRLILAFRPPISRRRGRPSERGSVAAGSLRATAAIASGGRGRSDYRRILIDDVHGFRFDDGAARWFSNLPLVWSQRWRLWSEGWTIRECGEDDRKIEKSLKTNASHGKKTRSTLPTNNERPRRVTEVGFLEKRRHVRIDDDDGATQAEANQP